MVIVPDSARLHASFRVAPSRQVFAVQAVSILSINLSIDEYVMDLVELISKALRYRQGATALRFAVNDICNLRCMAVCPTYATAVSRVVNKLVDILVQ